MLTLGQWLGRTRILTAGADAFDDEIGFESRIECHLLPRGDHITAFAYGGLKDGAFAGHVGHGVGTVCVLEVTFHRVHLGVGTSR